MTVIRSFSLDKISALNNQPHKGSRWWNSKTTIKFWASLQTLKRRILRGAYRKLARKYHPDLNPEADAEAKFKEVAEAWEVLKDKDRRAEYDELRRYGGQQQPDFEAPPGWQSTAGNGSQHFGGDFSEFFNSIFGGQFTHEGPGTSAGFWLSWAGH